MLDPTAIDPAIRAFLPTPGLTLRLVPLSAACALLTGGLVAWLHQARGVRVPDTRKVFHFIVFSMAGVVQLVWGLPGTMVFGSVLALAALYAMVRGDGYPFYEALARPSDRPHRTLFILLPLLTTAAGGITSNLLFPQFAFVGYLVAGWGDAVGEPVGTRWGRRRYRVPSLAGVPATRSIEGSLAVFLVGSLAAALGLLAVGTPGTLALGVGLACGLAGALVEAASTHGLDNFTVQLAAAGVAYWLATP